MGIDVSCVNQGYVAVSVTDDARLKFQVECGDTKYNYDLPGDGTPTVSARTCPSGCWVMKTVASVWP